MAPDKKSIFDLTPYYDTEVIVSFSGGRRISGLLRGSDNLSNVVIDDAVEVVGGGGSPGGRKLGRLVARGTAIISVSPPGKTIENPLEADLVTSEI
jgi:U6 snRNA-associated Sm-like protein LSm7